MEIQEIVVYIIVIIALIYSLQKFLKQFGAKKDPTCSHCTCNPVEDGIKKRSIQYSIQKNLKS